VARIIPLRDRRRRAARPGVSQSGAIWALIVLAVLGISVVSLQRERPLFSLPKIGEEAIGTSFAMCGVVRRDDCVVDGDTFWYGGDKIRIADIDAPETHPPRCEYEARLGAEATRRLLQLLNEGPFTLRAQGRDEDRYGRKLRIVTRDRRSLGGVLVSEGLAREWTGHRQPWCPS
jgi:micrococcal nuclease